MSELFVYVAIGFALAVGAWFWGVRNLDDPEDVAMLCVSMIIWPASFVFLSIVWLTEWLAEFIEGYMK